MLDKVFEFKEKYIYGHTGSDKDEEFTTLGKLDIECRIAHLKDKAKAAAISLKLCFILAPSSLIH